MEELNLPFEIQAPNVNESIYKDSISDPKELCQKLARLKVEAIHPKTKSYVIGADQMVYCDGQIFGKPKTHIKAIETLSYLQGKTHQLVSALCIRRPDNSFFEKLSLPELTMKSLTLEQIESYLNKEQPYECAGSYKIESDGQCIFEKVEPSDITTIMGLPMKVVRSELVDVIS